MAVYTVQFTPSTATTVIKPKEPADRDDVLTPAERALLKKAEREMKQGKFVSLAELHHDLERKEPKARTILVI
jgi:hypothetical protein